MARRIAFLLLFTAPQVGWGQNLDRYKKQFDTWDKNGDGKLARSELPEGVRRNFNRVDANGDGWISRKEDANFRQGNRERRENRPERLPAGVKLQSNIAYINSGHDRQKLDLYYFQKSKDSGKPRPLVIWIHGGGWRAGSKDRCPATFLLEHGFAVASINYRLSQHAIFPAQIQDCKAAISWLKANAKKYYLDAGRFGVWGSSAGGHLSALVGTSANVKAFEPAPQQKDQSRVQAVCDWFGPTDFLKMNQQAGAKGKLDHDLADSPESKLVGGAIQQNKSKTGKLNPIQYISKEDPPFLIMHGDQDFLVPLQQSQLLHAALQQAGVESTLRVMQGKGHGGFDAQKVRPQIIAFFKKHLMND